MTRWDEIERAAGRMLVGAKLIQELVEYRGKTIAAAVSELGGESVIESGRSRIQRAFSIYVLDEDMPTRPRVDQTFVVRGIKCKVTGSPSLEGGGWSMEVMSA